jgi:hypothetical protein
MTYTRTPLRMQVLHRGHEAALHANDMEVVAACLRLLEAERLGRRNAETPADWQLVYAFANSEC